MLTSSEIHRLPAAPSPDAASEPADDLLETSRGHEIVTLTREGDPETWAFLYRRCYIGLYRQLRYLTGDRTIAEELAQEAFAQALVSRARYDGRHGFQSWLHGIALNIARKHWRKRRNAARASERLEALHRVRAPTKRNPEDPDRRFMRKEHSRALYTALDELPHRLREAFILREIQGLSRAEAAELLGITPNNLAVRVSRARGRLRTLLTDSGWIPDGGAHGT